MLAAELLLLLYVGAFLAPNSVLGRWLIRAPARALAGSRSRRLTLVATILFVTLLITAPELALLVGLADVSLLADFTAIGLVMGATIAVELVTPTFRHVASLVGRLRRPLRLAFRRRVGRRLLRPPRSDEADDVGWAFA